VSIEVFCSNVGRVSDSVTRQIEAAIVGLRLLPNPTYPGLTMFEVRNDEPKYAFLNNAETKEQNRYGLNIELTAPDSELRYKSLNINGDEAIGENPDRYKQHGFYFNADNCIGCHACESACSEKNDVPIHLAYRSVGFVEGGTYPDYQRLNISMACNHCDDPVCLTGCPTRAYTKFAEYGAVLQDPDICFGCGYCTWVCPYNAPQLDPLKGEVSKCNMCVDRLEVNFIYSSQCITGFQSVIGGAHGYKRIQSGNRAVINVVYAGKQHFWTLIILCPRYTNHYARRLFLEK